MTIATIASITAAGLVGCSGDDDDTLGTTPNKDASVTDSAKADTGSTTVDSGTDSGKIDATTDTGGGLGGDSSTDAGTDTSSPTDAGADTASPTDAGHDAADAADAAPLPFCASQTGLAFCADFDNAGSLDAGNAAGWDSIVSTGTEVTLSSGRASSAPNSLLIALLTAGNGDRSAKVVKMISPAAKVTQAIYEFDIYLDTLPKPGAGGFVTDWQFSDALGAGGNAADTFGFRIAVFSDANGAFEHAELQHNAPALNPAPADDVINPFPLVGKKWNHVKMVAAFSATGGNSVSFQAYVDSATAVVNKTYPAPFAQAPFTRIADGVVFAFDGNSKDYGFSFDNITLKLQ